MLTDAALRNFKTKSKIYKASDRDGMYVTVSPSGTINPAQGSFFLLATMQSGACPMRP